MSMGRLQYSEKEAHRKSGFFNELRDRELYVSKGREETSGILAAAARRRVIVVMLQNDGARRRILENGVEGT
jgi:hypothetical protein